MGALEVSQVTSEPGGGLSVKVSRPATEQGVCAFWSPKQQALIQVAVKAEPQGVDVKVA
jgi:hypothetical protein